jgi:branched-chain amino acid transport system ATP-binding protein
VRVWVKIMANLLTLSNLKVGYGAAVAIEDLSLNLGEGRSLAVLGRNGVGKTTLLNSIIGATRRFSGTLHFNGCDITNMTSDQRALAGIGWVPQERNIFRSLTVEENMLAVQRPGSWDLARVYKMFPRLAERKRNLGNQLSGGEQQMLAIGRALVINPKLLLLDEPTEGLAPIIVEELLAALTKLFREDSMSGLIVEQHAQKILGMTDEAIILERGAIAFSGISKTLLANRSTLERHLGVASTRDPTSKTTKPNIEQRT